MAKKNKLKVFEAFAGIGAQHAALSRLNINYEIVGISEWFIEAIECYDAIHCVNIDIDVPDRENQLKELSKYTFSNNSVDPYNIAKLNDKELEKLYIANKRSKNFGSITEIKGQDLPDFDFLTYSFPCQDLSTGGKTLGMKKGSGTRSGLLWEIERILIELKDIGKLPEYLLLENVAAILAKSNHEDLTNWLSFLESIGYCNDEPMILDASNYGVAQDRKRVFIISHLGNKLNITENDLKKDKSYKFSDFVISEQGDDRFRSEYDDAQLNATPSRLEMWDINGREWTEQTIAHTITCNMDRKNTSIMLKYRGPKGDSFRLLTIREAFLLMGYSIDEYNSAKKLGFSYRKMNRLIGNSIVVNVLVAIFDKMFSGKYRK